MLDIIDGWHRGECNGMELLQCVNTSALDITCAVLLQQYASVSTILF